MTLIFFIFGYSEIVKSVYYKIKFKSKVFTIHPLDFLFFMLIECELMIVCGFPQSITVDGSVSLCVCALPSQYIVQCVTVCVGHNITVHHSVSLCVSAVASQNIVVCHFVSAVTSRYLTKYIRVPAFTRI